MIKLGVKLYCKKDNHWDSVDYCHVGQVFIISEIRDKNRCIIKCIDYKGKRNRKKIFNTSSLWLTNPDEEVVRKHGHHGVVYLFDYFEDKIKRVKRIAQEHLLK